MAEMTSQVSGSFGIENEVSLEFKVVNVRAIGKDVTVSLSITNLTTDTKDIVIDIRASSILYTRKELHELLKDSRKVHLTACEVREEPVVITYAQYEDLLSADNAIEVTAVCSSEACNGTVITQTSIVLDNPKFEIKLKGKAQVDKPVEAEVVFTNPFSKYICGIVLTAEGSGLIKDPVTIRGGSAKPHETIMIPITVTPYKAGKKHLLVDFTCNKFQNAKGFLEIDVEESQ